MRALAWLAGLSVSAGLCSQTASTLAWAAPRDDDKEYSAEAAPRPSGMPLSPLPEPPKLELERPRPLALQALDGVLERITSPDPLVRERAAQELLEGKPDWVSAVAKRVDTVAEHADREAMSRVLGRVRDKARAAGASSNTPGDADYLGFALGSAEPQSKPWRDLVQLLALARVLEALESTPAARELIRIYVRFDFMRLDVQRRLERMGESAIPALYEAKRHPATKVADWAKKQLELRGRAVPQEAVRVRDPEVLSDVLLALGRAGELDAARLLVSFAGSDRHQVRLAARQALTLLGEASAWQLRDAYQDLTGKAPPRDWTWKRLARELFTELDRTRLANVFQRYEQALAAKEKGDLVAMKEGFDAVLAESPLFEAREEMAPLYLEFALRHPEPRQRALGALRRAERISHDEALRRRIESRRVLIEAELLEEQGLHDRALYERAASLDPKNTRAAREAPGQSGGLGPVARYALALTVVGLSLGGAGWVLWTARRRPDAPP